MSTIKRMIFVAAGVFAAVWLGWLVLGGVFSTTSSVVPHAWVLILAAVVIGLVAWVWQYPAAEINTLGENKIVWGVFQTVLAVGFVVLFVQAVLWVNNSQFLSWAGIDGSPRVRAFMNVVVVSLCLFPLPPLINWIIPTSGIFAKAVWRTFFATAFLLLVASFFLPKTLFDPATGAPLAKIDSEGNTFYDGAKKYSPSTGEELKPLTTEQAKKMKPWWEQTFEVLKKWSVAIDRRSTAVQDSVPKRLPPIIISSPTDPYIVTHALQEGHTEVVLRLYPNAEGKVETPWFQLGSGCGKKLFYWDLSPRSGKVFYEGGSPDGENVGKNLPSVSFLKWEVFVGRFPDVAVRLIAGCK